MHAPSPVALSKSHPSRTQRVLVRLASRSLLALLAWFAGPIGASFGAADDKPTAPPRAEEPGREATPAVVHPAIRSPLRPTVSLDGEWAFRTDPKLIGETEAWFRPGRPLPSARTIRVPGCWEAQGVGGPGLSNAGNKFVYEPVNLRLRHAYTGAAWYKKEVNIPAEWQGRRIWLKVGGINAQGRLYLNGVFLGHHAAYCGSWKYDVTDLVRPGEKATAAVLVRNDMPSRRGESNCVRLYGGIFRSIELDATPDVSIDNVYAEPLFDRRSVRLHITLRNASGKAPAEPFVVAADVTTTSDQRTAGRASQAVAPSATTVETTLDVALDPFRPWSPEQPSLYAAHVTLQRGGRTIDGWAERFGVKKYEVRSGDYYLNNVRYFVRGFGDDHVYPETICSPASQEEHIRRLKIAKAYGFNYVRHHTHCEIPEFYEAADEVGILIQPELPYYGEFSKERPYSHLSGAPLTPKDDLRELVAHYRRYTSLAVYCGGNEGFCPSPLGEELYRLAKSLDPSRPWLCMDGGQNNTARNSEVNHYGYGANYAPVPDDSRPHVKHEFLSLGLNEDPRLESRFTGGYAPNAKLSDVKRFTTEKVGLDWHWAEACFNAGYRLQGIWHKVGVETTRNDPRLDGFSLWLLTDITPSTQCGVLDMFLGPKHSTPEFFQQFNAPTVVTAQAVGVASPNLLGFRPETVIRSEGETFELDWVLSHFQSTPLENASLAWRLTDGDRTTAQGEIAGLRVAAGGVQTVGRSRITMPATSKALRMRLTVEVPAASSRNAWDLWVVPKHRPQPDAGRGIAASPGAFERLAPRYPGLVKLGTPEAAAAKLVILRDFYEPGAMEALEQGRNVLCLALPGRDLIRPGTTLAEWSVSNQTGTAVAAHPAFGDFPHTDALEPLWFRVIDQAEKLDPGHPFRNVEPLMVGIGRATGYAFGTLGYPLGFNLHVFQAKVGRARLLASGLNLSTDHPEAAYLLDQFIRYAASERFQPKGEFDLAALKERIALVQMLNGWSKTVQTSERTEWHSFLRTGPMHIVRQLRQPQRLVWKTAPQASSTGDTATFRWIANLGWQSQPAGGRFTLSLGDRRLMDFDISLKSTEWKSDDGRSILRYTVRSIDRNEDSSGIMELTVPRNLLPAGDGPVVLRVDGSGPESRRYFGLQER